MTRLRIVSALALLALMVVSAATAASPSEIYADYADNGRLDRTYSDSDLRNALNDAAVQGYGKPTVTPGMRGEIEEQLGEVNTAAQDVDTVGRTSTLPFTGVDLALLTVGAGFLLLLGLGFRRLGRPRA
jgi:opacity protein-like surface antigen